MMTPLRFVRGFVVPLIALLPIGCSGDNSRAAVSGQVTLDGQPVEQGRITFVPLDVTAGPTAGAVIRMGRYDIRAAEGALVGKNRVEVRAAVKTGKQLPSAYSGAPIDETRESILDRYNEKSDLVRDIKPGKNQFDFELTSQ
jgi:hypothetical protein